LKINSPKKHLRAINVGSSFGPEVGQKVFAIGHPFGFGQTLTAGVISGIGREIESVTDRPIRGVIQTDAAIDPGNSSGPLLNSAGRGRIVPGDFIIAIDGKKISESKDLYSR